MTRVWPLVFCVGCRGLLGIDEAVPLVVDGSLHDGTGVDVIDSGRDPDAPPAGDDVAHVLADDEYLGTADLLVTADLQIDTTNLTVTPALPAGVTLTSAGQDGGGPELAILRVGALDVASGVRVRAIGTRPLVVLATSIDLAGTFDVAALHEVPGAGGLLAGPGAGGSGTRVMTSDGGGGGGSFGVTGARGGNASCVVQCTPDQTALGGLPGTAYNSGLGRLQGGSGGGAAVPPMQPTVCPAGLPGAGGGALQLYARTSIAIGATGVISAGGGGGRGGFKCELPMNWLAGNGGGSGGAIFLQSPTITNGGMIAANGGAGGSGAGMGGNGIDGEDARPSTAIAAGGAAVGSLSARGGNGGANNGGSQGGTDSVDNGNGGGGGGAVGQLVVFYRTLFTQGTTSPPPLTSTY